MTRERFKHLHQLVERAQKRGVTPELREQRRRAFVLGSGAIEDPRVTPALVREAAETFAARPPRTV